MGSEKEAGASFKGLTRKAETASSSKRQENLLPHLLVSLHIFQQILLEIASKFFSFRKYRTEFPPAFQEVAS